MVNVVRIYAIVRLMSIQFTVYFKNVHPVFTSIEMTCSLQAQEK